jgi:hypothetical protein
MNWSFNVVRALLVTSMLLFSLSAFAGGPLMVGGPAFGIEGQAFTWDPASMPIQYRVDPGPMATTAAGAVVINNASGLTRVAGMFGKWSGVSTAAVSFSYAGPILAANTYKAGQDVTTLAQYNDISGSCKAGTQNPLIFDGNGSLVKALGADPSLIGFASICKVDPATGHIKAALAVMNGQWQDGVRNGTNGELTAASFDEAITHEIGHFLGLDHSQINNDMLSTFACDADGVAGLPLMFPFDFCPAKSTFGLPIIAPDDAAWISKFYPAPSFATSYGTISGYVLFPDGLTQAQGVNVIARRVEDSNTVQRESRRIAFSVVSGYQFTGNPGQSITATYLKCTNASDCPGGYLDNNSGGDASGSRNPLVIGYYEIPVTPGSYTVEVESINSAFTAGSSVGPLDPPIPLVGSPEFWNSDESPFDDSTVSTPITVAPGQTLRNINILMNGGPRRFDQLEDSGADLFGDPGSITLVIRRDV